MNGLSTQWAYAIGIAVLILIPLISFVLWVAFGRDPRFNKTMSSKPPQNLNPAEAGYIIDGSLDTQDMAALVFYFARKGYVDIIEGVNNRYFIRKKTADISQAEGVSAQMYFSALFGQNDECYFNNLPKDFYKEYMKAKEMMKSEFTGRKRIFKRSTATLRGVMICVTSLLAGGFPFVTAFSKGMKFWYPAGVIALVLFFIGAILIIAATNAKFSTSETVTVKKTIIGVVITLVAMAAGFIALHFVMKNWIWSIFYLASLCISLVFSLLMRARTKQSVGWMNKMLGLRMFIRKGDVNKIRELQDREEDYFYQVLPYAFVMEVSEKWTKNFKGLDVTIPAWIVPLEPEKYDFYVINSVLHSWKDSITRAVIKMQ